MVKVSRCPFATDFDATGADADCMCPYPRGLWAKLKRFLFPWCTSGFGGRGDGTLPCGRFSRWRNKMANDTHGVAGQGWYGFDLDGTLAVYDRWRGIDHIGEPIKPMVDLVKRMQADGRTVKILTARVAPRLCGETHATGCKCGHCEEEASKSPVMQEQYLVELGKDSMTVKRRASDYIRDWCADNLGFIPEIVYQKDHLMLNLFDDRVVQVEPNTGRILGRMPPELVKCRED